MSGSEEAARELAARLPDTENHPVRHERAGHAESIGLARDRLLEAREELLTHLSEVGRELRRVEAALRALGSWEVLDRRHSGVRRIAGGPSERALAALTELGGPSTVPQVVEQMIRDGWTVGTARPDKSVFRALTRAIVTGEVCKSSRGKYEIVPDASQPKDI